MLNSFHQALGVKAHLKYPSPCQGTLSKALLQIVSAVLTCSGTAIPFLAAQTQPFSQGGMKKVESLLMFPSWTVPCLQVSKRLGKGVEICFPVSP